ncbi:conserved hypothetical protein [Trichinella spiralis]|uniref:hypothetical protein n=1 Tax=Trichinella spiralis TaxID=6334 RepID=UPI0001EFCB1C|nr:conserved hypothetical protein [Trichinella spiralis]
MPCSIKHQANISAFVSAVSSYLAPLESLPISCRLTFTGWQCTAIVDDHSKRLDTFKPFQSAVVIQKTFLLFVINEKIPSTSLCYVESFFLSAIFFFQTQQQQHNQILASTEICLANVDHCKHK